jgi:hypothetical protein
VLSPRPSSLALVEFARELIHEGFGAMDPRDAQHHMPVEEYSIDFRTVHLDDVTGKKGALNLDSACTGTALRDFLRVSDLSRLPEASVLPYESAAEIRPPPREVA